MERDEALNQLCKMAGEIAACLGMPEKAICVCGESDGVQLYEMPDEVIEEMWRRLTDPRWS